jgi:hypothetical protein
MVLLLRLRLYGLAGCIFIIFGIHRIAVSGINDFSAAPIVSGEALRY